MEVDDLQEEVIVQQLQGAFRAESSPYRLDHAGRLQDVQGLGLFFRGDLNFP